MKPRKLYVAVTGSNHNDGTIEKPWQTIQHGINQLKPGDTLLIRGGTYYERLHIDGSKISGTEDAMITIKSYDGETAVVDGSQLPGFTAPYQLLLIVDASYLRIEGLTICNNHIAHRGWEGTPEGIHVLATENGPGSRHIEIVNNLVHHIDGETWGYHTYDQQHQRHISSMNGHGIAVYGRGASQQSAITDLLIQSNEVCYCKLGASESIVVNGNVDDFRILNNYVHDNNNIGIDVIGGEGVSTNRELNAARNGVVSGNVVINNTGMANQVYHNGGGANGIYIDGGKDTLIEYNFVVGSNYGCEVGTENLGFDLSANIVIRHNVFTFSEDTSILLGGTEGAGDIVAKRNTVYGDAGAPVSTNEGGNYVVKDNILIASNSNNFWDAYGDAKSIAFDNNVYYRDNESKAATQHLHPSAADADVPKPSFDPLVALAAGNVSGLFAEDMPVKDAPGGDFTPTPAYFDKGADIETLKATVGAELYQKALNNYKARVKALDVFHSVYTILDDPKNKGSVEIPLDASALGNNLCRHFESLPGVAGTGTIVGMKRSSGSREMTEGAYFEPGSPGSYLGQVLCGKDEDGKIVPEATKQDNVVTNMRIYFRVPYTSDGQVHYIDRQVSDVCIRFTA